MLALSNSATTNVKQAWPRVQEETARLELHIQVPRTIRFTGPGSFGNDRLKASKVRVKRPADTAQSTRNRFKVQLELKGV